MNKKSYVHFILLMLGIGLSGCGFHLRGALCIPTELQRLQICPEEPFNPFQKQLRLTLQNNGVQIINGPLSENNSIALLTILSTQVSERTIAFGIDGQNNRVMIQLLVMYKITTACGSDLISPTSIQVERELNINPNAVLGTNREREKVFKDLYIDATAQIIRNLSPL